MHSVKSSFNDDQPQVSSDPDEAMPLPPVQIFVKGEPDVVETERSMSEESSRLSVKEERKDFVESERRVSEDQAQLSVKEKLEDSFETERCMSDDSSRLSVTEEHEVYLEYEDSIQQCEEEEDEECEQTDESSTLTLILTTAPPPLRQMPNPGQSELLWQTQHPHPNRKILRKPPVERTADSKMLKMYYLMRYRDQLAKGGKPPRRCYRRRLPAPTRLSVPHFGTKRLHYCNRCGMAYHSVQQQSPEETFRRSLLCDICIRLPPIPVRSTSNQQLGKHFDTARAGQSTSQVLRPLKTYGRRTVNVNKEK